MKKIVLFIIVIFSHTAYSQVVTKFQLPNQCTLDTVHIPIVATAQDSIGSISLTFSFDTSKGTFIDIYNEHPEIAQKGYTSYHFNQNQVFFIWYGFSSNEGFPLQNDTLFYLKFYPKTYTDIDLHWDTLTLGRCAYTNNYAQPLTAEFISDTLNLVHEQPSQLLFPTDMQQGVSTAPQFRWSHHSCDIAYRLEISTNPSLTNPNFVFNGLTDTTFNVVGLSLNTTYYWQITRVGESGVEIPSGVFAFTTTSSVNTQQAALEDLEWHVYPNPVYDNATIVISTEGFKNITISVINSIGQIEKMEHITIYHGTNHIPLNMSGLAKGLYILKINDQQRGIEAKTIFKN